MIHNSSLVCVVGIAYVYIDTIFAVYVHGFVVVVVLFCFLFCFLIHLYCLFGCLSMVVWTHAVLGVI